MTVGCGSKVLTATEPTTSTAATDAAAAQTNGSLGARIGLGASTVGSASSRAANRAEKPGVGSAHRRSASPMT